MNELTTTNQNYHTNSTITWPYPNLPNHWVAPYGWKPYPYVIPIVTTNPPFDYPSHTELLELLKTLVDGIDDYWATQNEDVVSNLKKIIERMGG